MVEFPSTLINFQLRNERFVEFWRLKGSQSKRSQVVVHKPVTSEWDGENPLSEDSLGADFKTPGGV